MDNSIAIPRIFFVPGKNPKPAPELHHDILWRCLLHGVQQVNPDIASQMAEQDDCFTLIPWNYIYYNETSSGEALLPWIDRLCLQNGASAEDREEARSWHRKTARMFIAMGDRFPWFIPLIPDPAIKASIREMSRYFANRDNIACQVREHLKKRLRDAFDKGERILLIGHSLGSVISFDSLWELWYEEQRHDDVDLFLSIGSPLGMQFFQHRMVNAEAAEDQRYPGNIHRWKNVSSVGDLVTLDTTVHDDYEAMITQGRTESIEDYCEDIYNYFRDEKGLNVHRSYGYLVNPVVGKIIARWWQQEKNSNKNNN